MSTVVPSNPGFAPESWLSGLGSHPELRALARESDPDLFCESLLSYGLRRESAGEIEAAARVYARVQEVAPGELSRRAARRLDAIVGRGAAGPRAEFLLRRLADEASDPAALFAMGTAVTVFRLARLASLARLSASPAANLFTRGFGARAAASLAGFALEAPTFTFAGRLANQALGREQDWAPGAVGRDLASSYLVLGGLKLAGWASGAAYRGVAGSAGALREGPLQNLFQQGGMLGGILLGHHLEERIGLRPAQAGATTLVDSMAMLLQFHVAGRLSRHAFGERLAARELELEARHRGLESFAAHPPRWAAELLAGPPLAMAALGPVAEGRLEPLRMQATRFPPSPAPAYENYHFPPGGKGQTPPRLSYGETERRLWAGMETELRAVPFEASREEILSRRLSLETPDRLWEFQIRDFARLLGAEVETHPPERLIEPFSNQFLRPKGDLLRRAADFAEGGGRVYEIRFPYANASFGKANVKGHYSNLRHLMGELEDAFGREVQLQFLREGRLRVRIPNFALWEGLLRARFGEAAHRPIPVDGIITRDDTMRLRGKLLAPVGMVRQATLISELGGKVHSFFVPFHDLYHATMASMLPPELCASCAGLYFPLQRGLPPSRLKQEHLNRLADLDPGADFNGQPETFVKFTLLPFWHSFFGEVEAGTMTQRRLQQYPQFLASYRRILRDEAATPGVTPLWREGFERRLNEFGDEFTRLLTSVLRK